MGYRDRCSRERLRAALEVSSVRGWPGGTTRVCSQAYTGRATRPGVWASVSVAMARLASPCKTLLAKLKGFASASDTWTLRKHARNARITHSSRKRAWASDEK